LFSLGNSARKPPPPPPRAAPNIFRPPGGIGPSAWAPGLFGR